MYIYIYIQIHIYRGLRKPVFDGFLEAHAHVTKGALVGRVAARGQRALGRHQLHGLLAVVCRTLQRALSLMLVVQAARLSEVRHQRALKCVASVHLSARPACTWPTPASRLSSGSPPDTARGKRLIRSASPAVTQVRRQSALGRDQLHGFLAVVCRTLQMGIAVSGEFPLFASDCTVIYI